MPTPPKPKIDLICERCNSSFRSIKADKPRRWCSRACKNLATRARHRGDLPSISLPTGTVGSMSELRIAADLLARGYYVFRSLSPNSPCDIIAMGNGNTIRIEVTTAVINWDGTLGAAKKRESYVYDVRAIVSYDGSRIEYRPAIPDISAARSDIVPAAQNAVIPPLG